ncbi:MAG TPA: hypothetical protein VFH91_05180 [Pyrinomonadaceae bacterium]|jgi:hypothetical protein|nr:hypothetical protein [Pyrinomonadaceae bacterium]
MDSLPPNVREELIKRHKAASVTIVGLVVAILLLSIIAYLARPYFRQQVDSSIDLAVRLVVFVLGAGSIVWRRTKFATMRLQDIGSLQGALGVMKTLERTTIQVALLSEGVAVSGFLATAMTGNALYSYWSGVIAIILLVYHYPRRASWNNALLKYAGDLNSAPA